MYLAVRCQYCMYELGQGLIPEYMGDSYSYLISIVCVYPSPALHSVEIPGFPVLKPAYLPRYQPDPWSAKNQKLRNPLPNLFFINKHFALVSLHIVCGRPYNRLDINFTAHTISLARTTRPRNRWGALVGTYSH